MNGITTEPTRRRRRTRQDILARKRVQSAKDRAGKHFLGAFVTPDIVAELNFIRDSVGGTEDRVTVKHTLTTLILRTAREIREGKLNPSVLAP